MPADPNSFVVPHIVSNVASPFISITTSRKVASDYAVLGGPSGYIYEIKLNSSVSIQLLDPVKTIAIGLPDPLSSNFGYQHQGDQTFLSQVVNRRSTMTRPYPPTDEWYGILWALRDAEILVLGDIPARFVAKRDIV